MSSGVFGLAFVASSLTQSNKSTFPLLIAGAELRIPTFTGAEKLPLARPTLGYLLFTLDRV